MNTDAPQGALILVAGRLKTTDDLQSHIHHVTNDVYELFQQNGYTDDRIYYLATDLNLPGATIDSLATAANLQAAITNWAPDNVGADRPLTLYMMDHGSRTNGFYLDETRGERINPQQLDAWLTQLETARPGVKINIFLEACFSGTFTEQLSKPGRVIITSTSNEKVAYASNQGAIFSDHFITGLRQQSSIYTAFEDASAAVRAAGYYQIPWLDDNGNGQPNESSDGQQAQQRGFSFAGTLSDDQWPPYILEVQTIEVDAEGRGEVRARVEDNESVEHVWAVIYEPSYQPPAPSEELVKETLPTLALLEQGNGWYGASYTGFDADGTYRVVVYADDNAHLEARPVAREVQVGEPEQNTSLLFLPLLMR
jgi:hypothetical protein